MDMHQTFGCSMSQNDLPERNLTIQRAQQVDKNVDQRQIESPVSTTTNVDSSKQDIHENSFENSDGFAMRVVCPKCGKNFKNKSNLKIHMLTHSGVKPFG